MDGEQPVLRDYIQVWFRKGFHIVYVSSINYIRTDKGVLYLSVGGNDEQIRVTETLEHLLDRLPKGRFVRIHRRYAVHITHVQGIKKGYVTLSIPENKQLSISKEGKARLLEALGILPW